MSPPGRPQGECPNVMTEGRPSSPGWALLPLTAAAAAVAAALAGGHVAQLATQVLVLWGFGLGFQWLFGRSGLLSFGHAVPFGLAAFGSAHAVAALQGWPAYELLPLVGAAIGLACGLLLGYPITRRGGIAFSMVTLGLGELVAACFLMFPAFFGGEAGITLQRTRVPSLLGLDYGRAGTQLLLTLTWTLLLLALVQALARTPFGLAAAAVRENPQRVAFLGLPAAALRWRAMMVGCAVAGVAGTLSALAYEIVTVDAVSLHMSAQVLLLVVIGGLTSPAGPLVGALFLTLMHSVVSDFTRAWLFYYGFVFVVLVWTAPQGLVGLWQGWRRRPPSLRQLAATFGLGAALVVFVETAYQLALGEPARLPGWAMLTPGVLKLLLVASGLAVAWPMARLLRQRGQLA